MNHKISEALKSGFIGCTFGGVVSGLLNYFICPLPTNLMDNVIGHSIGGFFCGFFAGLVGVLMYTKASRRSQSTSQSK